VGKRKAHCSSRYPLVSISCTTAAAPSRRWPAKSSSSSSVKIR